MAAPMEVNVIFTHLGFNHTLTYIDYFISRSWARFIHFSPIYFIHTHVMRSGIFTIQSRITYKECCLFGPLPIRPSRLFYFYPRVTRFDALKRSTDICAHRITFSSGKIIILNKLSCTQSKQTFWEVREHLFCLKYRCVRVPPSLFWQTPVSTPFIGCWRKRFFHCSLVFTWVYFVLYKNDQRLSAVHN